MASSTKYTKLQQRLLDSFGFDKRRQCLCRGSIHQGDLAGGGKQCTCISLSFLVASEIPKSTQELDGFLERGTLLYHSICNHGGYLLLNEIPDKISLPDNEEISIEIKEPFAGMISQSADNNESLTYTVESALRNGFTGSKSCFLTVGNDPGYTIGIKLTENAENNEFIIMDSHSRDQNGLSSVSGKAVLLKVISYIELKRYVKDMTSSLFQRDVPFEVTPITYSKVNVHIDGTQNETPVQVDTPEENSRTEPTSEQQSNYNPETIPTDPSVEDVPVELPNEDTDRNANDDTFAGHLDGTDNNSTHVECQTRQEQTPSSSNQVQSVPDIYNVDPRNCPGDIKYTLINNRVPESGFKIPSRLFNDKRCKSGSFRRNFNREWFTRYDFISYSKQTNGIYCLACVLFSDNAHRRAKKLISEPYTNWKDATDDLNRHSRYDYHRDSKSRMDAFLKTSEDPSTRIDARMNTNSSIVIEKNRNILKSILKCIEFCGRRGIALRGHRDDGTTQIENTEKDRNIGNFKALIQFRIDSDDAILEEHLRNCPKNATYVSKTIQNELLSCIKMFIQNRIVEEVKHQPFGPFYGFQCDEVRDSSNWEQLGLVLRYVVQGKPVERFLEFIGTEDISGKSLCQHIIKSLTEVGLDIKNCRSQTMDGAGNMSGKNIGCAAMFSKESPRAVYHYCSSHDLSLVLCKSCTISEIHIMLDTLKKLGIFFTYSPKRSRRLEKAVEEYNSGKPKAEQITKTKFKIFCETRWTEKHTTLENFMDMYEPLTRCLEAISKLERGWDRKAIIDANGLLSQMKDSTFIVSFVVVHHFFGYFEGISSQLQGSAVDIVQGFRLVENVRTQVISTRNDEDVYKAVFATATKLSAVNGEELSIPRRCGRQTQRSNVPGDNPDDYFRRAIFLPFLDMMLQQLNLRFSSLSERVAQALSLIPSGVNSIGTEKLTEILEYFREDLPSPHNFIQEFQIWKVLWQRETDKPEDLSSTLTDSRCSSLMFPNITKILYLLMLTSVTSSSVERANSSLKFVKNTIRSTMLEDRLNALLLMFIHKDIAIDLDVVLDTFARRNPRKMLLRNPLAD